MGDQREVKTEIQGDSVILDAAIREDSSTYTLAAKAKWNIFCRSPNENVVDISVRYSSLLAFCTKQNEYSYLVLGHGVKTGLRVITVSDVQSSHVRVPEDWCVKVPETLPHDLEPQLLSEIIWDLFASTLLPEVSSSDVILLHQPPPSFYPYYP
ncbi:hypothetical protein GGS20DRAFT_589633 [Poronia punctata]|nr:hypothetical protein GGS20DRAFT_589633 [Poronia punctata]